MISVKLMGEIKDISLTKRPPVFRRKKKASSEVAGFVLFW